MRISLLLLTLALCGCGNNSAWQVETIDNTAAMSCASLVSYETGMGIDRFRFEVLHTAKHDFGYLIAEKGFFLDAAITLTIGDEVIRGNGLMHEGKQKISLPNNLLECVLEALKQNKSVHIAFDIFEGDIIAAGFPKKAL